MHSYIVQARFEQNGPLLYVGTFRARSHLGAIKQAAEILTYNGEDARELVATDQGATDA